MHGFQSSHYKIKPLYCSFETPLLHYYPPRTGTTSSPCPEAILDNTSFLLGINEPQQEGLSFSIFVTEKLDLARWWSSKRLLVSRGNGGGGYVAFYQWWPSTTWTRQARAAMGAGLEMGLTSAVLHEMNAFPRQVAQGPPPPPPKDWCPLPLKVGSSYAQRQTTNHGSYFITKLELFFARRAGFLSETCFS